VDFKKLKLKVGSSGRALVGKDAGRHRGKLNIQAIDIYGLSEVIGPG